MRKYRAIKSLQVISSVLTVAAGLTLAIPVHAAGWSVNGSDNPVGGFWNAVDVGWDITPNSSFTLASIGTDFSSSGLTSNSVKAVILADGPGGAVLDTSNSVNVARTGGLTTFNFATPTSLISGDTYLVGFEGVQGTGANVTFDPSATSAGPVYFDNGGATFNTSYPAVPANQPILNLAVTPESNGGILFLAGLAPLALVALYRRQQHRTNLA